MKRDGVKRYIALIIALYMIMMLFTSCANLSTN